jgi:glutamate dehydrogenase
MLLSEHIRLIAAFDHRDIFIDPEPGADAFAERKRLFGLPRSSWQDYDKAKISRGGGVFPRAAKAIAVSEEMRRLFGLEAPSVAPNDLIRAVLQAKVDLLWFGGIGTYVRASPESDAEVGDRANDALRLTAAQVNARVVGEGANLGVTQRGRIELAARGVRLNTDFIDNSAGVNTSDQEVNIKIALAPAVRAGKLSQVARNKLLAEMTEDVAAASLHNNYQQSLSLSLAERTSARELADYSLLMRALEARGLLDRRLEALPSDLEMQERARTGRGLTRPELAVLMSFAKIALQHDLLESPVPDAPEVEQWLARYFPAALRERFAADIARHSLRREIIALGLTNAIVNRGGPATAVRLAEETARSAADVAYAYLAAREVFALPELWQRIDALDGRIEGAVQLGLYETTRELLGGQTLWLLRNGKASSDLAGTIGRYRAGVAELRAALPGVLPDRLRARLDGEVRRLTAAAVPSDVAADMAVLDVLALAPPITEIAAETGTQIAISARAYLAVGEHLGIAELAGRAASLVTPDYYDRVAVAQALAQMSAAQATFARDVLRSGHADTPQAWVERQGAQLARIRSVLAAIAGDQVLTVSRLLVAAGQLGDLAEASRAAPSASARRARAAGPRGSAASGNPPARKPARRPRP